MILVWDIETTGLPQSNRIEDCPHIVSLAFAACSEDGEVLSHNSTLIRPDGWTIPEAATAVHKITTQDALARGLPLHEVLPAFLEAMGAARYAVAYSAIFDSTICMIEGYRLGLGWPDTPIYCLKEAISERYKISWPALKDLYAAVFAEETGYAVHDAEEDTLATARLLFHFIKRGTLNPEQRLRDVGTCI